jgi:branched-chain amino acid transport system substrate-binding protein
MKQARNMKKLWPSREGLTKLEIALAIAVIVIASIAGGFYYYSLEQASQPEEYLKLGVIVPLTGAYTEIGVDIKLGAEMAVEEINAAGGILGKEVQLIIWDDENKPEKGVLGVRTLAEESEVDAFLGLAGSPVGLAIQEVLNEYERVFMGATLMSTQLTENVLENYEKYKYFFRMVHPNASAQAAAAFAIPMLKQTHDIETVAFIGEDALYAHGIWDGAKEILEDAGIQIVYEAFHPIGTIDFQPELLKVKELSPDFLCIIKTGSAESVILTKQWYDLGVSPIVPAFCIDDRWAEREDFWDLTDGKCEKLLVASLFYGEIQCPDFVNKWKMTHNRSPTIYAQNGYDITKILADAFERAESTDTDKLIEALEATDYQSLVGRIVCLPSHDSMIGPGYREHLIFQWQDGARVIIFPEELATGTYVPT